MFWPSESTFHAKVSLKSRSSGKTSWCTSSALPLALPLTWLVFLANKFTGKRQLHRFYNFHADTIRYCYLISYTGLTHTRWWEDIWGLLNFRTPRGHYALMSSALERDWVPWAASLGFLSIFDDNDLETSRTVLKRSWICRFLGISGSSPKVLKHLAAAAGSAQDLLFLSWGHHERCQSVTGWAIWCGTQLGQLGTILFLGSTTLFWEIIAPVKRLRSTSSPEHLRWKF